jgi:hypothetical protein
LDWTGLDLPEWWTQTSSSSFPPFDGVDLFPFGEEFGVALGYSEPQFRHRVVGVEAGPFRFFELGESLSGTVLA